jgi:hypothetical protein
MYSTYYQAHIRRSDCLFLVAFLRSFEHLAFDRTVDVQNSIFEFFVSPGCESYFEEILDYLKAQNIVLSYQKLSNRLINMHAEV